MGFVKQLFNFYINSSIHVALSVYALTRISFIEFNLPDNDSVLYFNFFATITGYNFVKYFGVAKFRYKDLAIWLRLIQLFSLLCFVLMLFFMAHLGTETLFYVAVFCVLTFLYAIPFLPKYSLLEKFGNLRSIGGLKVFLIALIWTGVTVVLPLIESSALVVFDVFLTCAQRFLFVVALMLPFEIRDLQHDHLKLHTIPQVLGLFKTKLLGAVLLVVICVLQFFKNEYSPALNLVLILIMSYTFLLILISKKEQRLYYSSFVVEAVPVVWWLLACFFVLGR